MDCKEIGKILDRYAYKNGHDGSSIWNEWLEWMCNAFEWQTINEKGFECSLLAAKNDNEDYYLAMVSYFEFAYEKILADGGCDALGNIYENCYKSSYKASSTGQFFTPEHVCDMMALIVKSKDCNEDKIITHSDCCCGSGRLMISEWKFCDKYAKNLFAAGDIDDTSVHMSAMNFMVNGMVGYVEKRNALTQEWYYGYVVNACKVPFANNFCCLQKYTDENKFTQDVNRLYSLMNNWNVAKYRPSDDKTPSHDVDTIVESPVVERNNKNKEPVQLELFG
jgi:Type I restriction-modification system methyltransferase subunit